MGENYMMALDAGTTSSRCILFNQKGEICSMAQQEFTQHFPKPGWVEHDPLEIWETQKKVMLQAMEKLQITEIKILYSLLITHLIITKALKNIALMLW